IQNSHDRNPGHTDDGAPFSHHSPWAAEAKPGVDRNGDGGRKSHLLCRTYRNGGARAFGSPFLRGGVRGSPSQSEAGGNLAGQGGAPATGGLDEPGKLVVPPREYYLPDPALRQEKKCHADSVDICPGSQLPHYPEG